MSFVSVEEYTVALVRTISGTDHEDDSEGLQMDSYALKVLKCTTVQISGSKTSMERLQYPREWFDCSERRSLTPQAYKDNIGFRKLEVWNSVLDIGSPLEPATRGNQNAGYGWMY